MNRILWEPGNKGSGSPDLLFDWRPDLERLEEAARQARAAWTADPWALAAAECWLDLIDAELIALNRISADDALGHTSRRQLEDWRARVRLSISSLTAARARTGISTQVA